MIDRLSLFSLVLLPAVVAPAWGEDFTLVEIGAADSRPWDDLTLERVPGITFPNPLPLPSQTAWRGLPDSSGDWFESELWTNGVPDADTDAFIGVPRETLLSEGVARARSLRLAGLPSQLTQTGGRLELVESLAFNNSGVYQQIGGSLSAESLTLRSFQIISSRFPIITRVSLPDDFGLRPAGLGDVRFELIGGQTEIRSSVNVTAGRLLISGGRLDAGSLRLDASALVPSFATDSLRSQGIRQSGGVVAVDGELAIQNGTYSLSGGELTVGTLAMGDPMDLSLSFLGGVRSPEFVQTGGVLTVRENLELCVPGWIEGNPITIDLPNDEVFRPGPLFTEVVYRLEAGQVNVAGNTTVGSLGVAPALFTQSGWSFATAGTLRIEGEASRYELTGGELRAGVLEVGANVFNTGGTLAIGPAGRVRIEDRVTLGEEAAVEAAPGATIELAGGVFEINGPVTPRLEGLENSTLVITGGDQVSMLEAVSVDVGDVAGGFLNNAAWESLRIGSDSETGILELTDAVDNAPAATPEAVYVDTLFVGEGSTLDLGGLNLYYRQATLLGDIVTGGGALMAVAVPEPTTVALLASVIGLSAAARRRS